MLKSELEAEVKRLAGVIAERRKELRDYKEEVKNGLIEVLENNCDDAIDPVKDFCDTLGIPFPEQTIKIEVTVPYGQEIQNVEDGNYNSLKWDAI